MIYIIRHGQTEKNKANVLQGRSDLPLNDAGIQQAQEAGRVLEQMGISFDRIYSSPLVRAIRTAEIAAPGAPLEVDVRLIEMDYGPYEGCDLKDPPPELAEFFKDFVHNTAPEGMEPLEHIVERSGRLLDEIHDEALDSTILLSTHAIAMKGLLEYLTPDSRGSYWHKYIGNCAVYACEALSGGGWTVPVEIYSTPRIR